MLRVRRLRRFYFDLSAQSNREESFAESICPKVCSAKNSRPNAVSHINKLGLKEFNHPSIINIHNIGDILKKKRTRFHAINYFEIRVDQ